MVLGIIFDSLQYAWVIGETIDENLSFGELKGTDFNVETGADFIDDTIDTPPQEPACAGNQNPIKDRDAGYQYQQQKYPERYGDLCRHSGLIICKL